MGESGIGKSEAALELIKRGHRPVSYTHLGAVEEIEELIGITGIHRMEAYDISNTNGYESVASMIVYEDGKPKRNNCNKVLVFYGYRPLPFHKQEYEG